MSKDKKKSCVVCEEPRGNGETCGKYECRGEYRRRNYIIKHGPPKQQQKLKSVKPEHPDIEMTRTISDENERIMALEGRLRDALRARDKALRPIQEVISAVNTAVFKAAEEIKIFPPAPRVKFKEGNGTPVTAIIHASDWQLGKKTESYDSKICASRIKTFAEEIIAHCKARSNISPVRDARLYFTGDIVEGEGIFPTQAHLIDASLYRQVIVDGPRIGIELIMELLTFFETIHVVGVIGNHGSIRLAMGAANPESNLDRMLYKVLQIAIMGPEGHPTEIAKSGRVTWDIPDGPGERNFFAVDHVGDWGFLLAHGDQIKGGFAGFPFYGFAKKAWGWIDSINAPWDYLLCGHWHTPCSMTLNHRQVRVNGSVESGNTYAQEYMAAVGHPTQWLGFVHPSKGVISEHWLYLEERIPVAKRPEFWDMGTQGK